jgi:hypothetical protein
MKKQATKVKRQRSSSISRNKKSSVTKRTIRQTYPIHRRFLLNPATIFFLLCVGVFIIGWTYRVFASTQISSVIEAPPLLSGAVITDPTGGETFTAAPIDVDGTCPPSDSYVKLYLNGVFNGAAWCDANGDFSIESSLYDGSNTLVAEDFNITDLQGPTTPSVQVTYNPPAPPPSPPSNGSSSSNSNSTSSSQTTSPTTSTITPQTSGSSSLITQPSKSSPSIPPVLVTSTFHFQTFKAGKQFTWKIDLQGGKPPYVVYVNWGDGTKSTLHYKTDPIITLTHTYHKSGYFAIVVTSVDSTGQKRIIQLPALIAASNGKVDFLGSAAQARQVSGGSGSSSGLVKAQKWLLLAWPSYLVLVLMCISFWLGERQDFAAAKTRVRR